MKVLLLGSGGREHAIATKLVENSELDQLYIAPGNSGTSDLGENVELNILDNSAIGQFCQTHQIDLVIVGPEAPLVNGIVDHFRDDVQLESIMVFGPDAESAQLEGSKEFAKIFMKEFGIPTADYQSFGEGQLAQAKEYIRQMSPPIVLKADGLAAGKGVVILDNHDEAIREVEAMLSGKFGQASKTVVIEQFLAGIEFSVFAITDGQHYKLLPIAKDYKRIGEGDTGLNTGGMGSISPVPFVDNVLMSKVEERIVKPTIDGLKKRQLNYKGFVFFGLINVDGNPFVIEYNCRMGDPETQVVMLRLKSDLLGHIKAVFENQLHEENVDISEDFATAVVAVSGGYPGSYQKGKIITMEDVPCFHAGMQKKDGLLRTNGGRVIALTGRGRTLEEALNQSYEGIKKIQFEGMNYRSDIGFDL